MNFCFGCVCQAPQCSYSRRGHPEFCNACLKAQPIADDALEAVRMYRTALVELDPIDISSFLAAAADIEDFLLLSLPALVWDPEATVCLGRHFRKLEHKRGVGGGGYGGADLARAFHKACDECNVWKEGADALDAELLKERMDLLHVGGAGRFFGLVVLGKRLRLLESSPGGASKPAGTVCLGGEGKRAEENATLGGGGKLDRVEAGTLAQNQGRRCAWQEAGRCAAGRSRAGNRCSTTPCHRECNGAGGQARTPGSTS